MISLKIENTEYSLFRYKHVAAFVLNLEESLGPDEEKTSPI